MTIHRGQGRYCMHDFAATKCDGSSFIGILDDFSFRIAFLMGAAPVLRTIRYF